MDPTLKNYMVLFLGRTDSGNTNYYQRGGGKWVQKQMHSEHRDRVYWGLKFALMACQKLMGSVHEENKSLLPHEE